MNDYHKKKMARNSNRLFQSVKMSFFGIIANGTAGTNVMFLNLRKK
jgi:hypothetical protein